MRIPHAIHWRRGSVETTLAAPRTLDADLHAVVLLDKPCVTPVRVAPVRANGTILSMVVEAYVVAKARIRELNGGCAIFLRWPHLPSIAPVVIAGVRAYGTILRMVIEASCTVTWAAIYKAEGTFSGAYELRRPAIAAVVVTWVRPDARPAVGRRPVQAHLRAEAKVHEAVRLAVAYGHDRISGVGLASDVCSRRLLSLKQGNFHRIDLVAIVSTRRAVRRDSTRREALNH
mmetsp:Transcript_113184/g.320358  ORF Transcript_113184/g.320358 Transcript_113184/m.320358 type:complete len:231 (+) Transcript_113184:112-804(+)